MQDDVPVLGCPGDEVVLDYVKKCLPQDQAKAFEEHYFACDACFRKLESALEIHAAFADVSPTPEGRMQTRSSAWWALPAAAAALLAAGLWLWSPMSGDGDERSFRSEAGALAVEAEAAEGQIRVTWTVVAGADVYVVQLFSEDGAELFVEETGETGITIKTEGLIRGDGALLLRVHALDALREPLAASRLQSIGSR